MYFTLESSELFVVETEEQERLMPFEVDQSNTKKLEVKPKEPGYEPLETIHVADDSNWRDTETEVWKY